MSGQMRNFWQVLTKYPFQDYLGSFKFHEHQSKKLRPKKRTQFPNYPNWVVSLEETECWDSWYGGVVKTRGTILD